MLPEFDYVSYLINMAFLLGLLVLLAFVSIQLKRRGAPKWNFGQLYQEQPKLIEVLERKVLSPKHILYVIQMENQRWLIGGTDMQLQLLGKLENDTLDTSLVKKSEAHQKHE